MWKPPPPAPSRNGFSRARRLYPVFFIHLNFVSSATNQVWYHDSATDRLPPSVGRDLPVDNASLHSFHMFMPTNNDTVWSKI